MSIRFKLFSQKWPPKAFPEFESALLEIETTLHKIETALLEIEILPEYESRFPGERSKFPSRSEKVALSVALKPTAARDLDLGSQLYLGRPFAQQKTFFRK